MIIVTKFAEGFIATLYDEDEPVFNTEQENALQQRLNNGDRTARPPPPETRWGPGGHRIETFTYLNQYGDSSASWPEAVASLRSRKRIKSAEKRVRRAEAKLESERKRLTQLKAPQRIFIKDTQLGANGSYEEITDDRNNA